MKKIGMSQCGRLIPTAICKRQEAYLSHARRSINQDMHLRFDKSTSNLAFLTLTQGTFINSCHLHTYVSYSCKKTEKRSLYLSEQTLKYFKVHYFTLHYYYWLPAAKKKGWQSAKQRVPDAKPYLDKCGPSVCRIQGKQGFRILIFLANMRDDDRMRVCCLCQTVHDCIH